MAAKPTPGGSDGTYGTELNAFLDVGHDSDGTHTKSQMLTDMGWSPTSYAGGETTTFPNGLIVKFGTESVAGNTTDDVTYGTAFPTGFVVAFGTYSSVDAGISNTCAVRPKSLNTKGILEVTNGQSSTASIFWLAIGY